MSYGELKIDTITFTAGGVDSSVSVSGLVQNPTFTGNLTTTGTISGDVIKGNTISGVNVIGTTEVSGATVTGDVGLFGTITGGIHTLTSGVFASGTAANPSITFVDDLDTGLFTGAANTVSIGANGGAVLTVSGTNVGIGTTSPAFPADIVGAKNTSQLHLGATGLNTADDFAQLSFGDATNLFGLLRLGFDNPGGATDSYFSFHTNNGTSNNERVRITAGGNVGVGTSSPTEILHAVGNIKLEIAAANNATRSITARSDFGSGTFFDNAGVLLVQDNAGSSGGHIELQTMQSGGSSMVTALTIDDGQRVGIGTSSMDTPLQIYGASGNLLKLQSSTGMGTAGQNIGISFVQSGNTEVSSIKSLVESSSNIALTFSTYSSSLSERVRIDSSGRLLVGTTTAITTGANALLQVGTSGGGQLVLSRTDNSSISAGQDMGALRYFSNAGDTQEECAAIIAEADGTQSAGDKPTRLVFRVTADGGSSTSPQMTIKNDGKVGIGTTSPARGPLHVHAPSGDSHLHLTNSTTGSAESDGFSVVSILTNNEAWLLQRENAAMRFYTNSLERAVIDSSGRLLVGTSTARTNFHGGGVAYQQQIEGTAYNTSAPAYICDSDTAAHGPHVTLARSRGTSVGSNTVVQDGDVIGVLNFQGNDGTNFVNCARIITAVDGTPGSNDMPGRLVFSTTADGASSPTERMRIDNGGSVMISTTSTEGGHKLSVKGDGVTGVVVRRDTNNGGVMSFMRGSSFVGSITVNASATAYNTSSDYRLKENVTAVTDGITRLQQLKPSRFNFIADPDKTIDGFIAHEVQAVVPEAIHGEKDAVDDDGNPIYQGIDQSKLVPLLTAALQEAIGEIESLKARVAALESA